MERSLEEENRIMQEAIEKQAIEFLNSERRTRAILHSIVDGIVTFTPEGIIESLSPAAERMFGLDALEADGLAVTALFPPASQAEIAHWLAASETSTAENREMQALKQGGGTFTAEINLSRIQLAGKALFVMAVRDVTELKTARETVRKQNERVALLQEAAVIANSAGTLEEAVEATLNLICEHYWLSVGRCRQMEESQLMGSGLQIGEIPLAESKKHIFPVHCGDDVLAVMEFFAAPSWEPEEEDREIIRNIGSQLGRAIERERTRRSLLHAKDAAESATRAKSEFLANMSHELRTPMNGILGLAELLQDAKLVPEHQECLEALTTSASSLLTILNDILDFSKIEAGELTLEAQPFSLRKCVANACDFLSPLASRKGLVLECNVADDVPPACLGDAGRLQQILLNLMGNAIKFTAEGKVVLRVSMENERLRFEVQDTGIGIPSEYQATIFNKFTQGDASTTRKYGGTGLGLAISRQLVGMMGGEIGVASEPGKGSTFWFSIPWAETQEPAEIAAEPAPVDALPVEDAKILMVEDHPINQLLLLKLLAKLGVRNVHKAENGREALEALKRGEYTLALMDCQMPELDGYEATRAIRERESNGEAHLPIIAMTANAMVGDREKCLKAGMDDYLSKPIDLPRLSAALGRWLNVGGFCLLENAPRAESADPIDMVHLRHFTDGDRAEEEALFALFLERADANIVALEEAIGAGDETWRKAAHLLKGASGNLGAQELFRRCERAEHDCTTDSAGKQHHLNEIREELERVRIFIAACQSASFAA